MIIPYLFVSHFFECNISHCGNVVPCVQNNEISVGATAYNHEFGITKSPFGIIYGNNLPVGEKDTSASSHLLYWHHLVQAKILLYVCGM